MTPTSSPLVDGNKRLGWLSTAVFLELNGVATEHATDDDVYEFVVGIAAGEFSSLVLEGLWRNDHRTVSGVYATARTMVWPWIDPLVAKATSSCHGTLPPAHVRIKPWYRSRRLRKRAADR